jgi:hypothetical protein
MGNRFNYRCPHCGSPDHIEICAFITVGLTDSGAVVLDNLRNISPDRWSSSSHNAGCTACGYEGH